MKENISAKNKLRKLITDAGFYSISNLWYTIIGLGGGLIPLIILFKENKDLNFFNTSWISSFLFSIIAILIITFGVRLIVNIIKDGFVKYEKQIEGLKNQLDEESERFKQQAILPKQISLSDILPYTIEESRATQKYIFNSNTASFDLEHRLFYKIRGGNEAISFIEYTYGPNSAKIYEDSFMNVEIGLENKNYNNKRLGIKIYKTNLFHTIRVEFKNESLMPNEVVEYCILLRFKKYQSISKEEYDFLIHSNKLEQKKNSYSRQACLGFKKMVIELEFPNNYIINHPDYTVINKSGKTVKAERDRLSDCNGFLYIEQSGVNKLQLTIENPIVELMYEISWEPPSFDEMISNKFITTKQYNFLQSKLCNNPTI